MEKIDKGLGFPDEKKNPKIPEIMKILEKGYKIPETPSSKATSCFNGGNFYKNARL